MVLCSGVLPNRRAVFFVPGGLIVRTLLLIWVDRRQLDETHPVGSLQGSSIFTLSCTSTRISRGVCSTPEMHIVYHELPKKRDAHVDPW